MKTILLAMLLALGAGECSKRPTEPVPIKPTPSPSPTPWPKPDASWSGPHKWVVSGQEYRLVCRQSGKVITSVAHGSDSGDTWDVFGGDGESYGKYMTVDQAKAKAEEVVVNPVLQHKLLHCP